jgi:hypothetical protein
MKAKIILKLTVFLVATSALAVVTMPFPGWEQLTKKSPDIIIARCEKTPELFEVQDNGVVRETVGGLIESDIKVISVLKGETHQGAMPLEQPRLGSARLSSWYRPRQSEYYLIFSICYSGEYQAFEKYKMIPLGLDFSTNVLSGKTLDEQIQTLLQKRLDDLNRQMKVEQEEKARLESAFKK